MKFQAVTRRAEGADSYVARKSVSPVQTVINVLEGIFSLLGAAVFILLLKEGSFTKVGGLLDIGVAKLAEWTGIAIAFVRGLGN